MRILLVILQFPPDVNSTGLLLAQIGSALVERGHHVSVLTTFPHYEHFRIWPKYRGKLAQRSQYNGMDVVRLYVHATGNKQRMLDRFLSYFSFSLLATVAGMLRREDYDVILSPNGGFLTGVGAAVIGQLKRTPVVLNLQDLYPDAPIRTGQIRNRQAIVGLRILERYMYAKATHISVITPYFRQYLLAAGVDPDAVSVIPNFVDTDFIRPLPRSNEWSRQHGLEDKFVVTHAGNVGYAYDLDTLVDAASLLRAYQDILFLIVGDGVLKPRLEDRVRSLGLTNVRFLPYQPLESLPWLRATSDVQLALTRTGGSTHSMPSKVYEIMASGRPVLASADPGSDLRRLVDETGCGRCVEPRNPAALAGGVLSLLDDASGRAAMGALGRQCAEHLYSRTSVVDRYEDLLNRISVTPRVKAGVKAGV